MAGVILNDQRRFPIGTSVSAYLRTNWTTAERAFGPAGAPKGAAAAGPVVVAADGSIDFSGLAAGKYFAYASVDGEDRYSRFECKTGADSPGGDSLVTADALTTEVNRATAAETVLQPKDSDLTAIAALSTTTFGRALLATADAAALRSASGAEAQDSDLDAIAALSTTSFGRALLAISDAQSLRDYASPTDQMGTFWAPPYITALNTGNTFGQFNLVANMLKIPVKTTLTGLIYWVGTISNGNVRAGIWDSAGNKVAESASTAQGAISTPQKVPFTAPVVVEPGVYYVGFQTDSASARYGGAVGALPSTIIVVGSYGLPTPLAPLPTTFGSNGIAVCTY